MFSGGMERLAMPLTLAVFAATLLQFTTTSAAYYTQRSDCGYNRSHNFFYGKRSYYDRLLYSNRTLRGTGPYSKINVDVNFPPTRQPPRGLISYIEVLDNYRDGLGACAYLRAGGIGYRNATVLLTSSQHHPIDSTINVYGR